jgi:3-hydroxy-3-methylglutaryl CoA synthase
VQATSSREPLGAIKAFGVHVPRLRLARAAIAEALAWLNPPARSAARGARAIGNWDEDALTMAVEAARGCLASPTRAGSALAGSAAAALDALYFCSTTAPFADRDDAVMIASALGLAETVETLNVASSLRAGTSALAAAARRSSPGTLVVASDARLAQPGSGQELAYGDAAAAVLVGPAGGDALAEVIAARSVASDHVDHYRMSGVDFDYALEERWVRDEILGKLVPRALDELLASAGCLAGDVRHLALPAPAPIARRIADASGLGHARRDERVLLECGDAGAALPFLLLGAALESAADGDLIVLIGLGQGVDALLLRACPGASRGRPLARALDRRREEPSYTRYLSHRGLLSVDFGMRAERDQRTAHTVAYRKRDALAAFNGGRCSRCGTVQFPRSRMCVNPDCRAQDAQTPYRLADSTGRVKTFTEDWQAYAARPPYVYGNVEFSAGGNLLMELTDLEAGELAIDDEVRFVFRIKDQDRARDFRRYFWKATKAG